LTTIPPIDIAVVVPLYNKRPYIERTLASVLCQTSPPSQIIVIDDGSTDGSGDLVRAVFPGVSIIRQDNRGVGEARNAGLTEASSSWVAFIDADDVWSPSHLLEIRKLVSEFPGARLVCTAHEETSAQADMSVSSLGGERNLINYFRAASRDIGVIWTSAAAVHRVTALTVGSFENHDMGEDLELWARIALRHPVATSSAITALHTRGTGGAMDSGTRREDDREIVVRDLQDLSPSSRTVFEALATEAHSVNPRDLVRYLDSRVIAAIHGRLVREDSVGARALRKLLIRRWHLRSWVWQLVPSVPVPMLRLAVRSRSALAKHHDSRSR
jgi:glycosyltransferase involved in cell wall biosynthesis